MESSVSEQAEFAAGELHIQRDPQPTLVRTGLGTGSVVVVTYVTLINIHVTKRCDLDPQNKFISSDCEVCDPDRSNNDATNMAELKWTGKAYMCGNCRAVLKPDPSKQEWDLEKQLNIQRIQQQIELEALQHQQRMKYLQTLLLS